jgi:hypothetical protein
MYFLNKYKPMGSPKINITNQQKNASIFALLIDDISRMSASQQKLLWMDLNKKKLSVLAGELDKSVPPNNLLQADFDQLINEAKKNGRKKKG